MMTVELLIYDFDGVIADSENLANSALQAVLAGHGCAMPLDEVIARFMGKREADVVLELQELTGQPPDLLRVQVRQATHAALAKVQEVPGARATIEACSATAYCIGSSSSLERLRFCLGQLGMSPLFESRVFSAEQVSRGKPAPDVFLLAAQQMGVPATSALVIEDSVGGIVAARSAGMRAFGLTAVTHQSTEAKRRMLVAGAEAVFDSHHELRLALKEMLAKP